MMPGETFTWHCKHCPVTETLDDQDDAYRAARLHTITVHGVTENAPILEYHDPRENA